MSTLRVAAPAVDVTGSVASAGTIASLGEPLEVAAGPARIDVSLSWQRPDIRVDAHLVVELEIPERADLAIRLPLEAVLAVLRLAVHSHGRNQRGTSSSAGPAWHSE